MIFFALPVNKFFVLLGVQVFAHSVPIDLKNSMFCIFFSYVKRHSQEFDYDFLFLHVTCMVAHNPSLSHPSELLLVFLFLSLFHSLHFFDYYTFLFLLPPVSRLTSESIRREKKKYHPFTLTLFSFLRRTSKRRIKG